MIRAPHRRLCALLATLACAPAWAGMVSGPYLIWFNLAGDARADQALHDYTHAESDADRCWNGQALLLVRDYPKAITADLVRRAVLKREPAAQARLKALLRKGDEDLPDGYDGVIVVAQGDKPTLMSLDARGRIRAQAAVIKAGQPDWPDAFCGVLPPIYRKP